MNWSKDKSITLSRACVVVFALCLLTLDAGAYWFAKWFVQARLMRGQLGALLMASIYSGSVFAWICLHRLWGLLGNVSRGEVFTEENVRRMRTISWCCAWAAAICLASAAYYLPFGFVAVAAGFVALIVRIVRGAFRQAIEMRSELDLTI